MDSVEVNSYFWRMAAKWLETELGQRNTAPDLELTMSLAKLLEAVSDDAVFLEEIVEDDGGTRERAYMDTDKWVKEFAERLANHKLRVSDLVGWYGRCSCGTDLEAEEDWVAHLERILCEAKLPELIAAGQAAAEDLRIGAHKLFEASELLKGHSLQGAVYDSHYELLKGANRWDVALQAVEKGVKP